MRQRTVIEICSRPCGGSEFCYFCLEQIVSGPQAVVFTLQGFIFLLEVFQCPNRSFVMRRKLGLAQFALQSCRFRCCQAVIVDKLSLGEFQEGAAINLIVDKGCTRNTYFLKPIGNLGNREGFDVVGHGTSFRFGFRLFWVESCVLFGCGPVFDLTRNCVARFQTFTPDRVHDSCSHFPPCRQHYMYTVQYISFIQCVLRLQYKYHIRRQ